MSSTPAAPTPLQLLQHPARYANFVSLPPATSIDELLLHLDAASAVTKQDVMRKLLLSAAPATLADITEVVNHDVNQQLAALRWNWLNPNLLSCILSFLTTREVIQLRCVSGQFNKIGQQSSSFNSSTDEGSILVIDRPGVHTLHGCRVIGLQVHPDIVRSWSGGADQWKLTQKVYRKMLRCLGDFPSIEAVVTRDMYREDAYVDDICLFSCDLSTLCSQPFVYQLRRVYCGDVKGRGMQSLETVNPLDRLLEFHGTMDNKGGPALEELTCLADLVPNVQKLHMRYHDGCVFTIAPFLQLPHLAHLSITTDRSAMWGASNSHITSEHLLGLETSTCTLQSLHLAGSERQHELLFESDTVGLQSISAYSVKQLVLYNSDHRKTFSTHLAHFQVLRQLELISPPTLLQAAAGHRERLLNALQQLKHLKVLKLHIEREEPYRHTPVDETDYPAWSADDLTALLRMAFTELSVQQLAPTAGKALTVLVDAEQHTLQKLKLGDTELQSSSVVAVASKLDQLLLSANVTLRHLKRNRSSDVPVALARKQLPANVTFFDDWAVC